MPATLTATPEPANSPPRVRLDVTLPVGSAGVSVLLVRTDPDGRGYPVRLADPAVLAGSAWVGYDYEAPYGAPVTYSGTVTYRAASRTNMVANPSFEVSASSAPVPWVGTRDTTLAWVGAASLRNDTTGPGWGGYQGNYQATKPSTTYTASAYVCGTGALYLTMYSSPTGALVADGAPVTLTGAWQRVSVTGATPAGADGVRVLSYQTAVGANSAWMDGVLLDESAVVGTYFDGSTTDTATVQHGWVGAVNASVSTESPLGSATITDTLASVITLPCADVWLVHPGIPNLSMRLDKVTSLGDRARPVKRGIFEPYGRSTPLVVTDGRRKAVQATLTVRTRTLDELGALVALTSDAAVLLLNVPVSLGWGLANEYVSLGDLVESREVDIGADPYRVVSGPYLVVSRPVGGSQAQRTYADVLAEAATYQDLLTQRATYLEVLAPTV